MELTFIIMLGAITVFFGVCGYIHYLDNTDKRYVLYGDREFYCWCEGAFSGKMCCVSIYEYFPKKIFKNKYRAYKTFWIDDYETIKAGVFAMIEEYIKEEEKENKVIDKWSDFKD